MSFNQSVSQHPARSSPNILLRNITIAIVVLPTIFTAATALATSSRVQSSAVGLAASQTALPQNAPEPSIVQDASVQKVALNPVDTADDSLASQANSQLRLLGYGLFLLHIGLIPLRLSKGSLMKLQAVRQQIKPPAR